MFRKSMFVTLGLLVALMLGCEKQESAPSSDDVEASANQAAEGAQDAAVDAVDEATEELKDAAKDIKVPGQ